MPEPYFVEVGFPVNGLSAVTPFSSQEAGTSPDMLNMVPFDVSGRLRGDGRPGLKKFSDLRPASTVVQCLTNLSSTFVKPVLGDGDAVINGKLGSASPGFAFKSAGAGTNADVASSNTYLASVFGPDGKCYVVEHSGTTVKLSRYQTDGVTVDYSVTIFTASATPASVDVTGLTIDEDTVYLWYQKVANIGEGVLRLNSSDGTNRDSTTGGVWLYREPLATHIEKVFAGVSTPSWTVVGTTAHSAMKVFAGRLAIVGAPLKDGGAGGEHELVLYIVDVKTGIIDAVHDLGLDGTATSPDKGIILDLEFGLDGFVYVLMKDSGTSNVQYIRKVDTAGNGIWEITIPNTQTVNSICWNPDRSLLAAAGTNAMVTGQSLVLIDPDSKGVVDYASPTPVSPAVTEWHMVRCDAGGNYILFRNVASAAVHKCSPTFVTVWTGDATATDQARASVNTFWNSGTDEQGSSRHQVTLQIHGGVARTITESSFGTVAQAAVTGRHLSTVATRIYDAKYGVLTFFADGYNARYYDGSDGANGTMKNWDDELSYGALPSDMNGGFQYIEVWDQRVLIFGLSDDPSNYYFSARGNPFDWKLESGITGAAISGRLSPAGLFPEKLNSAIPYNEDLLILGGDHSMYQMTLDPAVDATLDLISDTVGMAPGRSWCKDGYGSVYFFGNNGGLYQLSLNAPPKRISNQTIDQQLVDVDVRNSSIQLVWDAPRQGIWIFIRPDNGDAQTQYFYDFRTEGFFPIKFANPDYNPVSVEVRDLDEPKDRRVLLGCADGYVRTFDDLIRLDDGNKFDKYFVCGPWVSRGGVGQSVMVDQMSVAVGTDVNMNAEILSGKSAEAAATETRSKYRAAVRSDRHNISTPRIRGNAVALKMSTQGNSAVAFESARLQLRDVRNLEG